MEKATASANFSTLQAKGFKIEFLSHSKAILEVDIPQTVRQLCETNEGITISIEEIIAGGGGEAKGTQRLRKTLTNVGWPRQHAWLAQHMNDMQVRCSGQGARCGCLAARKRKLTCPFRKSYPDVLMMQSGQD